MAEAKPSELFIGVVEFFGVLAPGAILLTTELWVLEDSRVPSLPKILTGEAQWVAFAVAAYTLGTFLFLMSAVIDELIYDPWREARWPKAGDLAYQQAKAIRDAALATARPAAKPRKLLWPVKDPPERLPTLSARVAIFRSEFAETWRQRVLLQPGDAPTETMNTLSWAKSVLMLQAPAAYADVLRYEAESKFFRSMILVAPAVGVLIGLKMPTLGGIAVAFAVAVPVTALSFLRYVERRYKGSEWAYRYLIARQFGPKPPPEGKRSAAE